MEVLEHADVVVSDGQLVRGLDKIFVVQARVSQIMTERRTPCKDEMFRKQNKMLKKQSKGMMSTTRSILYKPPTQYVNVKQCTQSV